MPRKPRIEYAGAFYHVITRGNQKQKIFKDRQDWGSSRFREIAQGRVAFTALAKDYGYRGIEIAAYLRRDPTAVTQYARKREEVRQDLAAIQKVLGARGK